VSARPEWLPPNFQPIAALSVTVAGVLRTQGARWKKQLGSTRMSPTRYFLVQQDDAWMIKFADEEFGPYKSKSEAMLFAVDAARKLAERGAETEVCLMGENGFFHAEWSNAQTAAV
jgi:hypothetical protein